MLIEIDTSKPVQIDWTAQGANRIVQNVRNLISTFRYEIAYNRVKGIDPGIFDKPADIVAVLYASEVHRVVAEYEPGATVKEVQFTGIDDEGNMQFKVVIDV